MSVRRVANRDGWVISGQVPHDCLVWGGHYIHLDEPELVIEAIRDLGRALLREGRGHVAGMPHCNR